ncbi:MAG: GNAT family N-acetyltransferase [Xanthomonadales bacterium]|nr:GNAT family N-acetyltransferase [Xanthomonadales bacterium]
MRDVTYQIEKWSAVYPEMRELWDAYWDEVRGDQEAKKLQPRRDLYEWYEERDTLLIVTARDVESGRLVGFHMTMVAGHHHHANILCGFVDAWYVVPAYRRGMVGYSLLKVAERHLRGQGVQRLYAGASMRVNVGPLFKRLGWAATEMLYSKTLEE